MAITAPFVDGKLVQSQSAMGTEKTTEKGAAKNEKKASSDLDKDAFLQLLVAQMKYQDPLEPTSNTEYISQYATFSELEQMQNMSSNLTLSRANETVGKQVLIESTSESGKMTTVTGMVEKVVYNGSKAYLSIDGALYSIDDLKQVMDDEYFSGNQAVEDIKKIIDKLPKVEFLSMDDLQNVVSAFSIYNNLSEYQLSLIPADLKDTLTKYGNKADEILTQLAYDKENAPTVEDTDSLDEETLDELMNDSEGETV